MLIAQSRLSVPALTHGEAYSLMTPVQFNLAEMQASIDQGKKAYTEQRYTDAIQQYTTVLDTLYNDVLPTIHLHCAAAYEMQHQYDLALSESQYASNHHNSFFIQASAYYFKRDYKEAINTYRKGMATVSCIKFPQQHAMLVQKHQQIVDELNKRNQWLQHMLPYEVLSRILSLLSIKDRIRMASTCRFFHRFLLHDWPDMWSHIDATKDLCIPTSSIHNCLARISPYQVRSVVLDFPDGDRPRSRPAFDPDLLPPTNDDDDDDDGIRLHPGLLPPPPPPPPQEPFPNNNRFRRNPAQLGYMLGDDSGISYNSIGPSHLLANWILGHRRASRIESLEIAGYSEERLCKILNSCKHSLKHLKLTNSNALAYGKHVLLDVAQICPHLRSISIVERGAHQVHSNGGSRLTGAATTTTTSLLMPSITTDPIMLPQLPNLSLTRLDLSLGIPESLLVEIMRKCSSLTSLRLRFSGNKRLAHVLGAIQTHCPQLQSFHYGNRFITQTTGFHFDQLQQQQHRHSTTTTTATTNNRRRGLHEIAINMLCGSSSDLTLQQRKELFHRFDTLHQQHRNTLQILRLLICSIDDLHNMTLLAQHGAPCLRSLELDTYSNDSQLLSTAIRACPLLENVDFLCHHPSLIDDRVLETLGSLTHLHRLSIYIQTQEEWPEEHLSSKGLTSLFFNNKTHSRLSDLTFHFSYETANAYMKHHFVTDLANAIGCHSSSSIRKLDIQGIWLSFDKLVTFFTRLQDSQIRQLTITLQRDHDTIPAFYPSLYPLDPEETRALGMIKYLDYLKIDDPEKLICQMKLKQILQMAATCNQQPFLLIHVENPSVGKAPTLEGCLVRPPAVSSKTDVGMNNDGQQQQQPVIRISDRTTFSDDN